MVNGQYCLWCHDEVYHNYSCEEVCFYPGERSEHVLTPVVIFVILPGCENKTPFEASIYNKIAHRYMLNSFVMF